MVRTQIQLTPDEAEAVKRIATEKGVSMAQVIRESIDAYVRSAARPGREQARQRALSIIGIAHGGPKDLAERHDEYLEEAYGQ